jgi:uncharacterized protein (TIGR03118 family)
MPSLGRRVLTLAACCGLALMLSGAAVAQSFNAVTLVSNLPGKATNTDPLLANPWGLAYAPGGAFWISDEASGWSTLYNGSGTPQPLQVVVPPASGTWAGTPTGIVFNGSSEFAIDSWTSVFIFATLDGTIQGWSGFEPSTTLIAVTAAGAQYTGLAITNYTSGNHIYAADAANNKVDMYDGNFNLVSSFTDPATPRGFAPFGIQDINGQVYVAYAAQSGGTGGFVDIFGEDGTYVKRLVQASKTLNQPWGLAVAPAGWGAKFGGALLVTNNSSLGNINAFNLTTGALIDTLKDAKGRVIGVNGMWGIEFGGGTTANGKTNQLFFTAGPNDADGYFGVINVVK